MKSTTFSPVTVLMSWCRLNTLTPVTSWTIASRSRPRRFDQLGPDLFEQVPPLLGRERLDQLLFGRGQDALEADHEQITDQVGVDVLGAAAHVILFEVAHPFANGGFDFALGFHATLRRAIVFHWTSAPAKPCTLRPNRDPEQFRD